MHRQNDDGMVALISALTGLLTVIIATDPDVLGRMVYRTKLAWAHRDRTNWARLRWMRAQVRDGVRYADDTNAAPVE